jgi:hypothetical protein
MIATDGIFTKEKLELSAPKDTGTSATGKPLGGWEEKIFDRGIFVARPGVYFPLSPTEAELKTVRGRGVGKAVVLSCWQSIVDAWHRVGIGGSFEVTRVVRFCGAKSSITRFGPKPYYRYRRAAGETSSVRYGSWIERDVQMSFHPMPKRAGLKKRRTKFDLTVDHGGNRVARVRPRGDVARGAGFDGGGRRDVRATGRRFYRIRGWRVSLNLYLSMPAMIARVRETEAEVDSLKEQLELANLHICELEKYLRSYGDHTFRCLESADDCFCGFEAIKLELENLAKNKTP